MYYPEDSSWLASDMEAAGPPGSQRELNVFGGCGYLRGLAEVLVSAHGHLRCYIIEG